jgi:hypothetical protein
MSRDMRLSLTADSLHSKSGHATVGRRGGSPTVREGVGSMSTPSLTVGRPPRSLTSIQIFSVPI